MPRRILVEGSGHPIDLVEEPSPNELHLQEVMKANPQLIPAEDLGLEGELLVVGRETTLASGAIDLLCLARSGDIVLIEFKTGPQNPDFRAALSQVLDYGSDLWRMTVADFDRGVVQRFLTGGRSTTAHLRNLEEAIDSFKLDEADQDSFDARLEEVLSTGDFVYVVAAQRFTPAMSVTLEYLNSTMRFGRFYLVEVVRLEESGTKTIAHSAQVVARPPRRSVASSAGPRQTTSEAEFIAGLSNESARSAMATFFATASSLGLIVRWRSQGVAIRIQTEDRTRPYSVAWALPEGRAWTSAHDLTAGIEHHQLETMSTVGGAVRQYVSDIQSIAGGKNLDGYIDGAVFPLEEVESVMPAIIDSMTSLVARIQSGQQA